MTPSAAWDASPLYAHDQGSRLSRPEARRIGARNRGQSERIRAWFDANPGPIAAHELAERLNLRRENGVACRLSELFGEGFLVKHDKVAGPYGIDVHRYRKVGA